VTQADYTAYLIEKARLKHTAMLLRQLLDQHKACINGVTAREASEWLELPQGKASETSVGIMLRAMGYKRYRRRVRNDGGWVQETRLFLSETPPKGWTR
jgi:hypothetical protein